MLAQAVLGGMTVWYGLKPGWVIGHFLLSMLLLVACVVLVWRAAHEPGTERAASRDRVSLWAVRGLVVLGAVTLAAGTVATAAGPHAGGEGTGDDRPAARLEGRGHARLGDPPARRARDAARPRRGRVLVPAARARDVSAMTQNALTAVCVLLACQGVVGSAQYAMELPPEMVWIHVVLAARTWLALLWAWVAVGRAGPVAPVPLPAAPVSGAEPPLVRS